MFKPQTYEIFDGLISEQLIGEIFMCIHQPVFKFGQKSNPGDTFGFWIANISDEVRATVTPLGQLWDTVERSIVDGRYEIARMYVNAYTFGDCPTVHIDNDTDGNFTALYYANTEWSHNWAGETVFYNQEKNEIIKSVYPKPGRIVVFDGQIPHVAREPNRICPFVRYTIAIKMERK